MVFGGFAMVALMIAVVGVAGVLAFSVSARTREFGIRLAIGSQPRHLLARFASSLFQDIRMPSALPVVGSAFVLLAAAIIASAMPAARAARVDVMQALRSE